MSYKIDHKKQMKKVEINSKAHKLFSILTEPIYSKYVLAFSLVIFYIMRLFTLIKYDGFFAIDEFFHISTTNPDFIFGYDRAIYLNLLCKIFVLLFGYSDLSVKLVPLFMGSISFICFIYLAYRLYKKPIIIFAASLIIIFHSLFVYNHIYIRMYVVLEALIMVSCVILFHSNLYKSKSKIIYANLCIALFLILGVLYFSFTNDPSAYLVLCVYIFITIVFLFENKISNFIKSLSQKQKIIAIIFCAFMFIIAETLIILLKSGYFIDYLPKIFLGSGIYRVLTSLYVSEKPDFISYFFTRGVMITIPFLCSGIYIFKDANNPIKIIYLFALIPFLGYNAILYNSLMFRSYVPYLSLLILCCFWCIEKCTYFISYRTLPILIAAAFTIFCSYPKNFFKQPRIVSETLMDDYGSAIEEAQIMQKYGSKLVCVFGSEMQLRYFRLMPDIEIFTHTSNIEQQEKLALEITELLNSSENCFFVFDRIAIDFLNKYQIKIPKHALDSKKVYIGYVTTCYIN